MLAAAVYGGEVLGLLSRQPGAACARFAPHQVGETEDGVQGCAQLVAHVGEKRRLGAVGDFGRHLCIQNGVQRGLALRDVAKDDDRADHGKTLLEGGCRVFDGDTGPVFAPENLGIDGSRSTILKGLVAGAFGLGKRGAIRIRMMDEMVHSPSQHFGLGISEESRSGRVAEGDFAVGIGPDDAVADRSEDLPLSSFRAAKLFGDVLDFLLGRVRVVEHALKVDQVNRFIAFDPGIVAGREHGDVPGFHHMADAVLLDNHDARHVVLQVRGLAQIGMNDRLDRFGPFPSRFEGGASDDGSSDLDQLDATFGKRANFNRVGEALYLDLLHDCRSFLHHLDDRRARRRWAGRRSRRCPLAIRSSRRTTGGRKSRRSVGNGWPRMCSWTFLRGRLAAPMEGRKAFIISFSSSSMRIALTRSRVQGGDVLGDQRLEEQGWPGHRQSAQARGVADAAPSGET
ncbi:MAG TPA: hypothetical protein PK827_12825 [Accumulibacter sp.]|uniref:hypothetical protein n=1 Tax=Accumulibacter sp. TaxID=2053492 RepID=UPI002C1DB2DA|nr:hypothetical protein [Accumulibacter sp.]HNJ51507.1 hypothetical protein [Accumulibacter sp.]